MSELQELVDDLAEQIGRSVVLDDRRLGLVAYCVRPDDVDAARVEAILHRRIPAPVAEWLGTDRLETATRPVFFPGRPQLQLKPRLCVPVVHDGRPVGFIWLIAEPGDDLSRQHMAVIREAVARTAEIMNRGQAAVQRAAAHEHEMVLDIVSGDAARRSAASRELMRDGFGESASAVTALVALASGTSDDLADRARKARRVIATPEAIYAIDGDRAIFLVAASPASAAVSRLVDALRPSAWFIGVGGPAAGLEEARESYEQALRAATVGATGAAGGDVTRWDDLGIYQVLSAPELTDGIDHEGFARLVEHDESGVLRETLEAYLDHAGNGRALTERLGIHRATVYYRVNKAFELIGVDKTDPLARLHVHVLLKLSRLGDKRGLAGAELRR